MHSQINIECVAEKDFCKVAFCIWKNTPLFRHSVIESQETDKSSGKSKNRAKHVSEPDFESVDQEPLSVLQQYIDRREPSICQAAVK